MVAPPSKSNGAVLSARNSVTMEYMVSQFCGGLSDPCSMRLRFRDEDVLVVVFFFFLVVFFLGVDIVVDVVDDDLGLMGVLFFGVEMEVEGDVLDALFLDTGVNGATTSFSIFVVGVVIVLCSSSTTSLFTLVDFLLAIAIAIAFPFAFDVVVDDVFLFWPLAVVVFFS